MPYNTLIQRSDVQSRIPQNVSNAMLTNLNETSAALELGTRIPMPAGQTRFPVLSALPMAYWVNGDTGLKQTSTMAWDEKFINVEELAVIVPVPDNVLDDASFDIFGEVRPAMETAIARKIDAAVFLDVDAPASFPDGLVTGATAAGNVVARGTATADDGGIHADISDLIAELEGQGFTATGGVARASLRSGLRRTRIPATAPIGGVTANDWYGAVIRYGLAGLWAAGADAPEAIVGDFGQMVVGVRRDFDYKLITEGVITNASNDIIFNLPQQDMVALRVTFRMGWQISNPINFEAPAEEDRYPFGVLTAPGA